jgi:hypothetical protein
MTLEVWPSELKKGGRVSVDLSLEERRQYVRDKYPDVAELIRLARLHFGESVEIVVTLDEPITKGR